MAFASQLFGLDLTVYMVRSSYEQKPYRRSLMHIWGAEVLASPSDRTQSGRAIRAADPDTPGSLGIAISEAVEDAATHADTKYSLGSVLNHVLLHQSVIGLETRRQLELAGETPDILIGCVGGGSNFGGFSLPFLPDKLRRPGLRIVAVEPSACPSLTKGVYAYDFGDTAKLTPLVKMFTLGHGFVPESIHAGGLRYHGTAPIIAQLADLKLIEAQAYTQKRVFDAARCSSAPDRGIYPRARDRARHRRGHRRGEGRNDGEVHRFQLQRAWPLPICPTYDAHLAGTTLRTTSIPRRRSPRPLLDLPKVGRLSLQLRAARIRSVRWTDIEGVEPDRIFAPGLADGPGF